MRVITVSGDLGKFKEGTKLDNIQDIAEYIRLRVYEGRDEASFTKLSDIRIRAAVTACDLADDADPKDVAIDIVNRIATEKAAIKTASKGDDDDKPTEPDASPAQPRRKLPKKVRIEATEKAATETDRNGDDDDKPTEPDTSRAQPRGELPEKVAMQLAALADVPERESEPFWHLLRHVVQVAHDQHGSVAASRPSPALKKAAQAARILNEAIGDLSKAERKTLHQLAIRHPRLREETRIRPSNGMWKIEIDELNQTTWLLAFLLSMAIGKTPPWLAGTAKLAAVRGKKAGTVKNTELSNFVNRLLWCVEEVGGALPLEKNKYFSKSGGPLADALTILRSHLPHGVIPEELFLIQSNK